TDRGRASQAHRAADRRAAHRDRERCQSSDRQAQRTGRRCGVTAAEAIRLIQAIHQPLVGESTRRPPILCSLVLLAMTQHPTRWRSHEARRWCGGLGPDSLRSILTHLRKWGMVERKGNRRGYFHRPTKEGIKYANRILKCQNRN